MPSRTASSRVDVAVVGSGPNGLAAAVLLARAGLEVVVVEAEDTVGGGLRTADLDLAPGLVHDLCSAVHPMAAASAFFAEFDLPARGVELRYPEISYAQPLDGGRSALAYRDLDRTVDHLGADGPAWRSLMEPLVCRAPGVVDLAMGDHRSLPGDLSAALAFGTRLLEQGGPGWNARWRTEAAPALLTGVAAHAITPLPSLAAAGTALLLGSLAHRPGWPLPVGGSQAIADALLADLLAHGGRVETGRRVRRLADLPPSRAQVFDTSARGLLDIAGDVVPPSRRRAMERFPFGNAAAKVDFVLSGPVPWADPEVGRAGTVHVGGTRAQMAQAERDVAAGRHAEHPMVLASDPAVLDPSRVHGGLRPLWTYAHVPAGSDRDMGAAVQAEIERFAPGFGDVVVTRRAVPAARMAEHNANYVGGDIAAGLVSMWRMAARPVARLDPYATGLPGVYLCSGSVPPGPGVHGMGGWHTARRVLRDVFGIRARPSLAPTA